MRAFPSLHEMARASEAELAAVPAMNATVARALQAHLAEWSAAKV
jgi:hypothetical protein